MWLISDGTLNAVTSVIIVDFPADVPMMVEVLKDRLRRTGGDPEQVVVNQVGGMVDPGRVGGLVAACGS